MDGVLVVDKPSGPTSHDVVATARRALAQQSVGHTGTLDPNATGVLVLVLGRATRLAQHLTTVDKEYLATVRFGVETDTYDSKGTVIRDTHLVPTRDAVEGALHAFRGVFQQMPPVFSAKKIASEPAYVKARQQAPVSLRAVAVSVDELVITRFASPLADLRIRCSAGFYVRSLAHDLGERLGCGAILEALERTRAGDYRKDGALPFASLVTQDRAAIAQHIIPVEALLTDYPAVRLTADWARRVRHGQDLPAAIETDAARASPVVRLLGPDGRLVGLARPAKTPGFLHPAVVLS